MDDNDVCPLCCEELDMSDRQFFPCKCGYQVCMWCWHRIRESESGLCPACRTPYGDDPHEFSAVDMEEVVKANKEKAAAEKRERDRLRQQGIGSNGLHSSASSIGSSSSHFSSGVGFHGDESAICGIAVNSKSIDPPRDRNLLANMRVIRRNLVYAVGLPPSIATEETLRKPEYFGQYGKISKIVINRNHNGNGDPRRASASAYVTTVHKEDALACILALDGFYLDGRNIRASYGTSKYCSAFIKSVRCNNPDCTYLHCMGESDDTFTKQEIQAGYVTSGRDVLAKQQQLMAVSSGSGSGSTRRRVGGGGPSGTGKIPASPVFPSPCYDEPVKPERNLNSTIPFGINHSLTRSSSTASGSGFSSVAAAGVTIPSSSVKIVRSSSISLPVSQVPSAAEKLSKQQEQLRRLHPQNNKGTPTTTPKKTPTAKTIPAASSITTAASVVAGGSGTQSSSQSTVGAHTTLTPLTPLKRSNSTSKEKSSSTVKAASVSKLPVGIPNGSLSNPSSPSTSIKSSLQFPPNLPLPTEIKRNTSTSSTKQGERLPGLLSNSQNTAVGSGSNGSALSLGALGSLSGTSIPLGQSLNNNSESGSNVGSNFIGGPSLVGGLGKPDIINVIGSSNLSSSVVNNSPGDKRSGLGIGGPPVHGSLLNNSSAGFGSSFGAPGGGGWKDSTSHNIIGGGPRTTVNGHNPRHDRWAENDLGTPSSSLPGTGLFGPSSFSINSGIWGNEPQLAASSTSSASSGNSSLGPIGNLGGFPSSSGNKMSAVGSSRSSSFSEQGNNSKSADSTVIGGQNLIGKNPFASGTGSSALASMLGIDLPTGSGSLRESNMVGSSVLSSSAIRDGTPFSSSFQAAPFSNHSTHDESIWGNQSQSHENQPFHSRTQNGFDMRTGGQGAIGSNPNRNGNIGGVTIGSTSHSGFQSTLSSNSTTNRDIASLQNLLPGVHITIGNAHQPAAPMSNVSKQTVGWAPSSAPNDASSTLLMGAVGGQNANNNLQQSSASDPMNSDTWGGLYAPNQNMQHQGMSNRGSIW